MFHSLATPLTSMVPSLNVLSSRKLFRDMAPPMYFQIGTPFDLRGYRIYSGEKEVRS